MSALSLPKLPNKGRPTSEQKARFEADVDAWCAAVLEINSGLDFQVSSRGWCYVLEEHGLLKGDFDAAQALINDCRKSGQLPLDICSEDEGRSAQGLERLDDCGIEDKATNVINYVHSAHRYYRPFSAWELQDFYVEVAVEKVDLKSLFAPVCELFHIPIQNLSGWNDINSRGGMMRRFAHWESKGNRCVLLYCGDHDPGGLHISDFLRSNFADLAGAVGWSPDNLIIERFGLDYDFIEEHGLTWINNLATSKKKGFPLDDPRHRDHLKPYVQGYLKRFGVRKCEANALVVRPVAGRALCEAAIRKYVRADGLADYDARIDAAREELRLEIRGRLETE